MGAGMFLWLAYQFIWCYFEIVLGRDVPDPFLGDIILFLHLVPMIAALGVLPHLRDDGRDERIRLLDFALLLSWCVFLYIYVVIPWQTVQVNNQNYSASFNSAYLTEKLVFLFALAVVSVTSHSGWRTLYRQMLAAGTLYAASSYVANWAIGHHSYYTGSFYDIPLAASVAWMGALPLFADRLDLSEWKLSKPRLAIWITRLSVVALFSLPVVALFTESQATLPRAVRSFRVTVTLAAMIFMGIVVFWRQRLLGAELSRLLTHATDSVEELQSLQERLIQSEKLASLGQLVGGAAHEINNPLTAVLGYSDLLSASNLPPHEREQATRIGEEVRRTRTLVSSLLTFARPAPAKLAPVDLNSVLQAAVRLLAPQLEAFGATIRTEPALAIPMIMADSNQILHVCLHLAGQVASQLGPSGELLVRLQRNEQQAFVDFFPSVRNASPPSFDLPLTPEGANRPSTLSLGACCRIAEEHGGRLLQASNTDIRAFRLELPLSQKKAAAQATSSTTKNS